MHESSDLANLHGGDVGVKDGLARLWILDIGDPLAQIQEMLHLLLHIPGQRGERIGHWLR